MNIHTPLSYLSGFLEEYPLYSKFGTDQPLTTEDLNGLRFRFFCREENKIQSFQLQAASLNGHTGTHSVSLNANESIESPTEFTEMFLGICQSCLGFKINVIINTGIQDERPNYFIRKIGQYPAPETSDIKLPKEIHYFLDDSDRDFYSKALKNMESGYGTGAFAYLRRVVENEMERIIETLSGFYAPGNGMIADAISSYRTDHHKTKFIETTRLFFPYSLKEHGASVLLLLYDMTWVDINGLKEEECLKKAKDIDALFRYLVRKINEAKDKMVAATGVSQNKPIK